MKSRHLLFAVAILAIAIVIATLTVAGVQTASAQTTPTCSVSVEVVAGTINQFDITVNASPNGWWLVQFGDTQYVDVDVHEGVASTFHAYSYDVGALTEYVIRVIYPNVGGLQRCALSISIDDRPTQTPTPTATPTDTPTPTPTATATPPMLDPLVLYANGLISDYNTPEEYLPTEIYVVGRYGGMPATLELHWSLSFSGWAASFDPDEYTRIRVDAMQELIVAVDVDYEWSVVSGAGGWDRINEPFCEVVATMVDAPNHYTFEVEGRFDYWQIRVDGEELVWYENQIGLFVETWLTIEPGQLVEYEISAAVHQAAPSACSTIVTVDNRVRHFYLPLVVKA
ncbi:hypothetical protein KC614_04280 [candidate division WWE3 bacterium]|uniref:Uncharacterized protein n=1 Tax=candidate division WWE3 bacterium TaxID=2053526 RepID=A0A955LL68_UNCKA|nr:hypothetical protein [candidate division WWE3 bacterium]